VDRKLYDEARRELFALLMKDVPQIKRELALVRKRTVQQQGYDTFKEGIVLERAAELLPALLTPDMEGRKKRLLDVAVQMMESQQVIRRDHGRGARDLRQRFERVFDRGRLGGIRDALELFYQRRD